MDFFWRILNWDMTFESLWAGITEWVHVIWLLAGWPGALIVATASVLLLLHFPLTHALASFVLADGTKLTIRTILLAPLFLSWKIITTVLEVFVSSLKKIR